MLSIYWGIWLPHLKHYIYDIIDGSWGHCVNEIASQNKTTAELYHSYEKHPMVSLCWQNMMVTGTLWSWWSVECSKISIFNCRGENYRSDWSHCEYIFTYVWIYSLFLFIYLYWYIYIFNIYSIQYIYIIILMNYILKIHWNSQFYLLVTIWESVCIIQIHSLLILLLGSRYLKEYIDNKISFSFSFIFLCLK